MISATIRDIAIIVVAIETIIINALLVILIWQIWRLVKMFQTEIKPIIKDTQETVGTVRGTAEFVTDNVVDPVVKTSGKVAGFRRTLQVLREQMRPVNSSGAPPPPPPTVSSSSPGTANGSTPGAG